MQMICGALCLSHHIVDTLANSVKNSIFALTLVKNKFNLLTATLQLLKLVRLCLDLLAVLDALLNNRPHHPVDHNARLKLYCEHAEVGAHLLLFLLFLCVGLPKLIIKR